MLGGWRRWRLSFDRPEAGASPKRPAASPLPEDDRNGRRYRRQDPPPRALGPFLLSPQLSQRLLPPTPFGNRPLQLPPRDVPRRPHEPHDHPDEGQQKPRHETRLLAVALPVRQPRRDDRRQQPDDQKPQRFCSDDGDHEAHVPRYAFCASGFSFSFDDSSVSATVPVSST